MLILTISKACNLWTIPDELISSEVRDRLNEINENWKESLKYLEVRSDGASTINKIIYVGLLT